jgi:hypothetical protein
MINRFICESSVVRVTEQRLDRGEKLACALDISTSFDIFTFVDTKGDTMKLTRKRLTAKATSVCDSVCQLEKIRDKAFVDSALWGPRV